MKKSLLAAALAAAILPAASFTAEAAGMVTTYNYRDGMACFPTAAMPSIGLTVKNAANYFTVPKGAKIELRIWTKNPDRFVTYTIIAPRALAPGESIRVKRPAGTFRCLAIVSFPRINKDILTRR
jgi:hypothetical protein